MRIKSGKFKNNRHSIYVLAVLSFVVYACGSPSKEPQEEGQDFTVNGDTISLAASSTLRGQLLTTIVEEQPFQEEWTTAGIVRTIPNSYAAIAAPFAGRVLRSFIKLGQRVAVGTPLFEISSSDFFSAQKEYFDAHQELHQAELHLKRQKDLLKNGVGIQRELEEAETAFKIKKSGLQNAISALKIFHVNPTKLELGKPLVVYSPIVGEIISNAIVIGQYVREDAEAIAVVAELSKVWVAAQVKEKDIVHLGKIKNVEVQIAAMPEQTIHGSIYHIGEMVNEETRSIEVLILCDNADRLFRPGMYVNLRFQDAAQQRIVVPSKAVFQQEDASFVFVKINDNHYQKRKIQTTGSAKGQVIIGQGLTAGETIVNDGGILFLR